MNIYDVAKEAGVSIATVSRVINNKGNVSDKTRAKIEAVMLKSGYQPSAVARGLANGFTKTIAIFAVDVRVPHYATTSYTMERLLTGLGYLVIICNTGEDVSDWHRYLMIMRERNIDGIILTGSIYTRLEHDKILDNFADIPIVMANGTINRSNVKSVFVDESRGIEIATEHLFSRGFRRLTALGIQDAADHVYYTPYGLTGGASIAEQLYKKGYNGLVFGEDLTAVGAMNALTSQGIRVPDQVGITGCNNSEYAVLCNPGLTSINNKAEVLSELTARLLADLLSKKKETAETIVIPELVIRGSS